MLLITGATGHSGGWFLRRLAQEGYAGKIRCVTRDNTKAESLLQSSLDIEVVEASLAEEDELRRVLDGVTAVVHIANIRRSERLVEIGHELGVEHFILVHTTGRYSKFKASSAEYIRIEDKLIETYDNLTILRPTMIYGGPKDGNIWRLIQFIDGHKFFPVFGAGRNLMQPVHARDLGDAYYACLMQREKVINRQYNLSGKDAVQYRKILGMISEQLTRKTIFVFLPLWLSLLGARLLEMLFGASRAPVQVEQVMRMREDKAYSHEEAVQDFGYTPMSLEDGIAEEVALYLEIKK